MNRAQYLMAVSVFCLLCAALFQGITWMGRQHGPVTVRLSYERPVEPWFVEPAAPEMPQAVRHPDTVRFCLARPGLAEAAHPCSDEPGELSL